MSTQLNAHQRRVLGVLIEKSMTTSGAYPLTLNSLVTGCNQLSCRDPVMHLTEGEVGAALHVLQRMQLVTQAPPDRNARSNRFAHQVESRLSWDTRERAIMAELLLRGPQTAGELRTNASRMSPLEDLAYVMELLSALSRRDPPLVVELPRQPGKSVVRFDHCLYAEGEPRESAAFPSVGTVGTESAAPPAQRAVAAPMPSSDLVRRIEVLESAVAEIRTALGLPVSGGAASDADSGGV